MEYMWELESVMDENDKYWGRERGGNAVDNATMDSPMVIDTDYWFMGFVISRTMFLWQGEQVDGSMFVWGPEYDDLGSVFDVLEMPGAVMGGSGISPHSNQPLGICVRLCIRVCLTRGFTCEFLYLPK